MASAEQLFLAGGQLTAKRSFQIYKPATKEFFKCGDAPHPCTAPAVATYGNVTIVAGGIGNMANIMMYYQETDSWRVEKDVLLTPRSHATAVINESKLYVIGGQGRGGAPVSSAEVFDLGDGRCSYVNNFRLPFLEVGCRKNYCVVVRDDKIYVMGGEDESGKSLNSFDVFLMEKNDNKPLAPLTQGRSRFAAVLLNNELVVMGGSGSIEGESPTDQPSLEGDSPDDQPPSTAAAAPLSSCERYNFETDAWTSFPAMTRPRESHCAAVCGDDRVYVIGGATSEAMMKEQNSAENANTIEVYDAKTSSWTLQDNLPISRCSSSAVAMKKKNMLLIGGRFGIRFSVQTYNPETDEFFTCSKPPKPIGYPGCTTLGNTAFVCGGSGNSQNVLMYHLGTDTWTGYFNIMRTPRVNPMACIHNGELHVVSGQNARGWGITSVETFAVSERGVSFLQDYELPPMVHPRHDYAVVCHKNKYYLIGGEDRTDHRCKQVEEFNFDNQEKKVLGELLEGRSRFAAVMFNDKLIAIGGLGHMDGTPPRPTPLKTVESYDFSTGKWSSFAPMTRARDGHCACVHDGKIWVFGGRLTDFYNEDSNTTTMEYYDPEDNTWHYHKELPVARWCTGAVAI